MNWKDKITDKFDTDVSLNSLLKVLAILLIVYLLSKTWHIWSGIINVALTILGPFIWGFVIAFIIRPLIILGEKKHISRKIVAPLVYVIVFILLGLLMFAIVPNIVTKLSSFITSLINSINLVETQYTSADSQIVTPLISMVADEATNLLTTAKAWVPNVTKFVPQFFNTIMSITTNSIFAIIISIYFTIDYEKITKLFDDLASNINTHLPKYFHAIDEEVGDYIHSLIILMVIKFVEYSILYFIIGHHDWVIIGLLTSIGLLVPYFGATVANCIGILTALSLPVPNIIGLLVGIVILSTVDAYVIAPMVHSKNSHIHPLWTLLSIFAFGYLFGPVGIMVSIPVYLSVRAIYNIRKDEKKNKQEETKTVKGN